MYEQQRNSHRLSVSLIISTVLFVLGVALWWSFTLFAVLLIIGSLLVLVQGICGYPFIVSMPDLTLIRFAHPDNDEFYMDEDIPVTVDEDLPLEIPLDVLEGIDPLIQGKLEELDIEYLVDLLDSDPVALSDLTGIPRPMIRTWMADAKAIIEGAQLKDLITLSNARPLDIVRTIQRSLNSGKISFPPDYDLTLERVDYWITAAQDVIARLGLYDR